MLENARSGGPQRHPQRPAVRDGCDNLKFAKGTLDRYAPYVISVVSDPFAVVKEMFRVCRPGGRIIFLNHFRSPNPALARIERAISPFTVHIGFKSDLDLPAFLTQADLNPVSIEKVNIPRLWSLITRKD
jgi:phosphatidylethanolamine/phosphatidyl-N-methylethanolamine N-methyltransferase